MAVILDDLLRHAALAASAALSRYFLPVSSGASLTVVINLTGTESLSDNDLYSVP